MLRLPKSTRAKFGPNLKLILKYKRASGQPTEVEGRPSPHLPRGGPSYSCLSCHLQRKRDPKVPRSHPVSLVPLGMVVARDQSCKTDLPNRDVT